MQLVGFFRYTRLPQGLYCSLRTFKRVMNIVLLYQRGNNALAYVFDTKMETETEQQPRILVQNMFTRLLKHSTRLELSNRLFGMRKVKALGC